MRTRFAFHFPATVLTLGTFLTLPSLPAHAADVTDVTFYATGSPNTQFPNGRIVAIDYTTDTITATFNAPQDNNKTHSGGYVGNGGSGIALNPTAGYLDVVDSATDSDPADLQNFYHIDPATGAVLSHSTASLVPLGEDARYTGLQYVGNELHAVVGQETEITNLTTNNPDTIPLGQNNTAGDLAAINNKFYLSNTDPSGDNQILTFSFATQVDFGQQLNSYATPNDAAVLGLAGEDGSLYATETIFGQAGLSTTIYELNPANGHILSSQTFPGIRLDSLTAATASTPEPTSLLLLTALTLPLLSRRRTT